jgi:hypothetical protein
MNCPGDYNEDENTVKFPFKAMVGIDGFDH